ncbi:MAG: hypothetical protein NUV78_03360 [Candidatus Zambryskibacteria bacterium]|nr:hypothetical protein [Candidatus Zambryskibacteria bacterium]
MKEGKAASKTYLVEVTPLTKGPGLGTLSYFSTTRLAPGTLVRVPVRKGLTYAVIINSKSALSAKSEIRQAGYTLKKIAKKDLLDAGFSPEFLSAVQKTAFYYACSAGALLTSLIPKMILEDPVRYLKIQKKKKEAPLQETLLLQMETDERYGQYRGLVRQCFARQASVLFVVPTHLDAARAYKLLSQGIEQYVYVFTLKGKASEAGDLWQKAMEEKHPILLITTSAGATFDRSDIDTVIMERENSRAYRTLSRPYIHLKVFLEHLAKESGKQLVLGDSVLSTETLWKEKRGDYGELSLIRWRLPAAQTTLVDASARPDQNGKFEIFSPELKALIAKALEEKERIFLFGARKGLAPTTVCGDCGFVLPCLNCSAPVVLHKQRGGENIYICHACGTRRDSTTTCGYCKSWKLVPLGIGIERIAAEARELFHGVEVEILDKDHASTDKKAASIAKKFTENGGILVGTELALFHLDKVPYTALISADSLFSIPDFSINDRIFYLVSRLREMTQNESLIQTRNIGKQILAWASFGNIIDFYLNEIAERKDLLYPPFSIFIKVESLSPRASQEIMRAKDLFLKWHPESYKNSLIIRVPRAEWPDEELVHTLSLLGREFSIKVDPESIL